MTNPKNQKFSTKAKAVVLGAAILASGAAGTFALLSDTATTDITITSADFGIAIAGDGVTLDATNLKPGETRSGAVAVTNDSSIDAVITLDKSVLNGFDSSVTNAAGEEFTTVTLPAGETTDLTLAVGLDADVTTPPAAETLKVTVNAAQTK